MLSRGYLSFHKTVSFLQEQRVKVCAFTKTYRLSRFVRYHENQTDLSPELPEHLQYQKVYSEKLMFPYPCSFLHTNRRIACVFLSVQQNISKRNNVRICKYKVKYCKIEEKF